MAIECKDVGAHASLDEVRAFIARLHDVTLLHAHHRYLPFADKRSIHPGSPAEAAHRAIVTYWQENRRVRNVVDRRTGFVGGTAPLAAYQWIEPHAEIVLGGTGLKTLVASVVDWARGSAR